MTRLSRRVCIKKNYNALAYGFANPTSLTHAPAATTQRSRTAVLFRKARQVERQTRQPGKQDGALGRNLNATEAISRIKNATEAIDTIKVAIDQAPRSGYIAELHLQIIKYSDVLQHMTGKEFSEALGIGSAYGTEFSKMLKISERLKRAGLDVNRI